MAPNAIDVRKSPHRPIVVMIWSTDEDQPQLLRRAKTYMQAGYQVRFVGWDRMCLKPKRRVIDGLTCEYIMRGWGFGNRRLLLGLPLWGLRLMLYVFFIRAKLIHVFDFECAFPVAISTFFRRIPFIYGVLDNYDLRHNWPRLIGATIRRLDALIISRAAGVIVPDENRIVGAFREFREKISIVYLCPPDLPKPDHLGYQEGKLTVLALGYLTKRRGIDLLLDAIRDLTNIQVIMAGNFVEPWLKAKALALPQVDFRGWVSWEEAIALGYQADVVFAFYDPAYEGNVRAAAQKWFDAMMTGTPILSNKEVINATWIEKEDIGYLCPYGDVQALAYTLHWILDHPEEASSKGQRGRMLFEQEYNWPMQEKKILNIVRSIIPMPVLTE